MKCCLQIGNLAAIGQTFDRLDVTVLRLHRKHQTGTHDLAIDAHRAGPADPMFAADMGTGQLEVFAEENRQV